MSYKVFDTNFDFRQDTPKGRDIDAYSATLKSYHKLLWSKLLPVGAVFELDDTKPQMYLYHNSKVGEFRLGSDAITHSYRNTKRMLPVTGQVSSEMVDSLYSIGCTIGAYIIFPSNKIDNKVTINGCRGMNRKIGDRFDLTLECIRLFYQGIDNPLSEVCTRYKDFFNLFIDFRGYVDFFLLQDLVSADYNQVKFHLPHKSFSDSPLPQSQDEYLLYRENTINFVKSRSQRMVESIHK